MKMLTGVCGFLLRNLVNKAKQKGKDLNKKPLSNTEIKVFKKELDYGPIQNKINKSKLRRDSEKNFVDKRNLNPSLF